ncbi:MAG: acyl-CoA dehydrogenase family protein [Ramlibacter sp.]
MRPHTDQQRMLADAARQFAADRCLSHRLRACRHRTPDHDGVVWREMAALGWLGVLVPEAEGGLGSGLADMGQLAYEWGAGSGPEPLVATGGLAMTLIVHGDGPARARLLSRTMEGEALPAVAWLSPGAQCTSTPNGWEVTGQARFVTPADATDFLLVLPEGSGQPVVNVSASVEGLSVKREQRADGSGAAWLNLQQVKVPEAAMVATGTGAWEAAERARDVGLVLVAVAMAGSMRTINAMTQDYLRTRVQFGKPIGSFQALQHKAVDMHIAEQLARDVAQNACARIDAGCTSDERACLASRAKARAGESLDRIARAAVQLHGAIGYTDEYDLSLHLNRALTWSAWLGNADEHVRRYARHVGPFEAAEA